MTEPRWDVCSAEELWEYVASRLARSGINTVLVGGGVVSVYTQGAHESGDLDFVICNFSPPLFAPLLKELGFSESPSGSFRRPDCRFSLDFSGIPPVTIGDAHDIELEERQIGSARIRIMSPTSAVCDRLASFIYHKSRDCLRQAVLVAKHHPVSTQRIEAWCRGEGRLDVYENFALGCSEKETL